MSTNDLQSHLTAIKSIINEWLHIDDDRIVDVIVGTYIANQTNADPLWVNIIGPPSHSKTELLRSFKDHKKTYLLSNLTPSTLVSGKENKNGEPSLLPKLTNKFVVLKDFTTILAMRSENQSEILAQLREIYDGQYSKAFGTGKQFNWCGRIGLIAGCTPAYDKHYAVTGALGERFLLYRTGDGNNREMGLQAQAIVGQEDVMRKEIRESVHSFIDCFHNAENHNLLIDVNNELNQMIVMLACVVAVARCPVERERVSKCILYEPQPEGTPRLVKQLMQMASGITIAQGKNKFDEDIYSIIRKIAQDQVPPQRLRVLRHLWTENATEFTGNWIKTKEIAEAIRKPSYTTLLLLEDLMVVACVNRQQEDLENDKSPYFWQLRTDFCEMAGQSEFFE